jgi:hypothetical protein
VFCAVTKKNYFKGNNKGNLKRHFTEKHMELSKISKCEIKKRPTAEEISTYNSKKIKKMSRGDYISECIKLVAIHFTPFSLLRLSIISAIN